MSHEENLAAAGRELDQEALGQENAFRQVEEKLDEICEHLKKVSGQCVNNAEDIHALSLRVHALESRGPPPEPTPEPEPEPPTPEPVEWSREPGGLPYHSSHSPTFGLIQSNNSGKGTWSTAGGDGKVSVENHVWPDGLHRHPGGEIIGTLKDGAYRCEIGPKHPDFNGHARQPLEGVNVYTWELRFPEGWNDSKHLNILGQLHADEDGTSPLIGIQRKYPPHSSAGTQWFIRANSDNGGRQEYPLPTMPEHTGPHDEWIKLQVIFAQEDPGESHNRGKGFWRVWRIHKQVDDVPRPELLAEKEGPNGYRGNNKPSYWKNTQYWSAYKNKSDAEVRSDERDGYTVRQVVAIRNLEIHHYTWDEWEAMNG